MSVSRLYCGLSGGLSRSLIVALMLCAHSQVCFGIQYPEETHNLLVDANFTSSFETSGLGLRGAIDHMIYDLKNGKFLAKSIHHEYGVRFMHDLGVVAESSPVWWQAEWSRAVLTNTIVLHGAYPNQPQPKTGWTIELRQNGQWKEFKRGVGGWYHAGVFRWGGPGTTPISLEGLRIRLFSSDEKSPLKSVHFRGVEKQSWVVANLPPLGASLRRLSWPIRVGEKTIFEADKLAGAIHDWQWDFGDGKTAKGRKVEHAFSRSGEYPIQLKVSNGTHQAIFSQTAIVESSLLARIKPFEHAVLAGVPVNFEGAAKGSRAKSYAWDFGDGNKASTARVSHTFANPGIYQVTFTTSDNNDSDQCMAIVRVHSEETLGTPQLLLDSDAKNEVDDQHFIAYGLFSDLDILGVNSIHHGGGQEPSNREEIFLVVDLCLQSGLPESRKPLVFRGADWRLQIPKSGKWQDTIPSVTPASEAILAAARGASPDNPVLVLPVGPGTNVASALIQAHKEGLDLNGRLRVIGLLGSEKGALANTFNVANDPWSVYVIAESGIEFCTILEHPTGASLRFDKRTEGHLYPKNPLGEYLMKITPPHNKSLFDQTTISMIIAEQRDKDWVTETEYVHLLGPDKGYLWQHSDEPTNLRLVRDIDEEAMKADFFETLNNKTTTVIE